MVPAYPQLFTTLCWWCMNKRISYRLIPKRLVAIHFYIGLMILTIQPDVNYIYFSPSKTTRYIVANYCTNRHTCGICLLAKKTTSVFTLDLHCPPWFRTIVTYVSTQANLGKHTTKHNLHYLWCTASSNASINWPHESNDSKKSEDYRGCSSSFANSLQVGATSCI